MTAIKCKAALLYQSAKMCSGTRVRVTNDIEALSKYGAESLAGLELTLNSLADGTPHGYQGRIAYLDVDGDEWYIGAQHITPLS